MPEGEYLQYGGQAIIEGVMMRSPRYFSVACRAPNGEIIQVTEAIEKTWIGRQKWLRLPFLRGAFAIIDSMGLGIRAMRFSSGVQMAPEHQVPEPADNEGLGGSPIVNVKQPNKKLQDAAVASTIVFSLALGLFSFQYLPNLLAQNLQRTGASGTTINFVTEVIKIVAFLGYIYAISRMKDIQEVFKYHGAEHKAINTMEAGQDLSIVNCQSQTRLHPRCGTSFAIIVLLVGLVVFTFVPRYPFGESSSLLVNVTTRFGLELLILPIIAGIAYELIRFAGKFRNKAFVTALFWPGLMSQYMTTREPREDQVEVALAALQACIAAENGELPVKPEISKDDEPAQIA